MTSRSTALRNNKQVFDTVEFERWIGRSDLDADERFILSRYLEPSARTLEAGTAGGRILFALRQMGFTDLHGFDFVPRLIEEARASDPDHCITFEVQDAAALGYPSEAFDQVVYLQQILSCMDEEASRREVLREACRILRPGGTALFSFLSFEVRSRNPLYVLFLAYLRLLRRISGCRRSMQALPWMRLGDRLQGRALLDRGPYVYWYRSSEALRLLKDAGFCIRALGTSLQIKRGQLCQSLEALVREEMDGALYCVCSKPVTEGELETRPFAREPQER